MSRDATSSAGHQATNDIRTLEFWKAFRLVQSRRTYCCTGCSATGPPTYDGQAPYIGIVPQMTAAHFHPFLDPLHPHIPVTRVPASPDSPPEHSATEPISSTDQSVE